MRLPSHSTPALVLIAVALSLGCGKSRTDHEVARLRSEVEQLGARVQSLETEVKELKDGSGNHAGDVFELQAELNDLKSKSAELSPGEEGYSILRTNGVQFMIGLERVMPLADGQRIVLRVGNPHAVTYRNPKFTVKWGKRMNLSSGDTLLEWARLLRTKEQTVLVDLRPGAWTDVTLTVAPATNEEVGYLQVDMETDQISLRR
jgi:hypothetical protein